MCVIYEPIRLEIWIPVICVLLVAAVLLLLWVRKRETLRKAGRIILRILAVLMIIFALLMTALIIYERAVIIPEYTESNRRAKVISKLHDGSYWSVREAMDDIIEMNDLALYLRAKEIEKSFITPTPTPSPTPTLTQPPEREQVIGMILSGQYEEAMTLIREMNDLELYLFALEHQPSGAD